MKCCICANDIDWDITAESERYSDLTPDPLKTFCEGNHTDEYPSDENSSPWNFYSGDWFVTDCRTCVKCYTAILNPLRNGLLLLNSEPDSYGNYTEVESPYSI